MKTEQVETRRYGKTKDGQRATERVLIRTTEQEKEDWSRKAKLKGYKSLSAWIRHLAAA